MAAWFPCELNTASICQTSAYAHLQMRRNQNPDRLSIDLFSRKMLEITITSQTIALAMKAAQFMQQDEDMLTKPRGADAPYRIRNQTGYGLHVWAVTETVLESEQMAVKLDDGEEAPWRFEEWEKMREVDIPSQIFVNYRLMQCRCRI